MNVTLQKSDAVTAKITVEITPDDYKTKVDEELKKIGRTHQIPGFRKGHVSIGDLRRRFGRQVTSDVINDVVFKGVTDYIRENKINVLGEPMPVEVYDLKNIDLNSSNEFKFEYLIALAPELDIDLNKDITIPYYSINVTDEMINEQDQAFRKRFGSQQPGDTVEPDALVKGPIQQLNADGSVKEGEDAIQVISGILGPQFFTNKEEAEKFIGKHVDDKVIFNPWIATGGNATELASMLQIDKDRVEEANCDFVMTISEIIVVRVAELNQEFYDNVFGKDRLHSEEEYRNEVKNMIAGELSGNSEMVFRNDARKVLLEKYGNMELPDEMLKRWLVTRNQDLNESNIDETYNNMKEDLKWQLIKERISQNGGIEITEDDLLEFAKGMAARQLSQYGMTNLDMETVTGFAKRILGDKEWRPRIVEQVGDQKLFSAIREKVTIDEKPLSLDEFKEMITKQEA